MDRQKTEEKKMNNYNLKKDVNKTSETERTVKKSMKMNSKTDERVYLRNQRIFQKDKKSNDCSLKEFSKLKNGNKCFAKNQKQINKNHAQSQKFVNEENKGTNSFSDVCYNIGGVSNKIANFKNYKIPKIKRNQEIIDNITVKDVTRRQKTTTQCK